MARRPIRTVVLPIILFASITSTSIAQEGLSISAFPSMSVPLNETADLYELAVGGGLEVLYPMGESRLNVFGLVDFQSARLQEKAGNVQLLTGGAGVSYSLLQTERFSLGPRFGTGGYLGFFEETDATSNPYYSAGLRGDLRLGSGFSLSLTPEYRDLITRRGGRIESFYSGFNVALSLSLSPAQMGGGTRRPQLRIMEPEYRQIFPVIYKYYDTNAFGTVRIRNEEKRAIEDVQVEFYVPRYMDGPQIIAEYDRIPRGEELGVPITALFNGSVMEITERDTAQSQISVSYNVSGASLTAQRNRSVRIYDRNAVSWDDDRKAAAFVTAKDPTILKFSRNVTSELGSTEQSGFNANLSDAVAIFEALRAYGLEYTVDPDSSYEILSQDESRTDYLQFPVQTLDYRTGDCDDLSILYSSMLEAVSIETAFVTTPGHIYLAFALGMSEEDALNMFRSADDVIIHQGEAWLPVETTLLNDGFVRAWEVGARQWREALNDDVAGFFPVRSAWSVYAPTGFSSDGNSDVVRDLPPAETVAREHGDSLNRFVQLQIEPMVERLETAIARRPSARLINRLGTIYARYGLIVEAEKQFRRAADEQYLPAMVNMGNVHYLDEDYQRALQYYEQAHQINPDNTDVLLSLARTNYTVQEYAQARDYYEVARLLDPARADEYAYIAGTSAQAGRASDISARSRPIWSDE